MNNDFMINNFEPKIGVIVTAYNMSQFIEDCIVSIINNTYKNLHIYIVEDCSTDDTLEKINCIYNTYKEKQIITVVKHECNKGAGQARRTGITNALNDNCDFIITIDADDWIDSDFIEHLVNKSLETGALIVSGGITIEHENGYWEKTCYGNIVTEGIDKITKFWGEKIVFMNNKIIHKSIAEKVPYCTRRFVEDTPTIIPMLYYSNKVAYCDNTGYHYRMQENSLTHTCNLVKWAVYRALCADDLICFFEQQQEGEEILKQMPLRGALKQQLSILKRLNPSYEEIKSFIEDYAELGTRLIKRLT